MLIHVVDDHEMMREATVAVVRRMRKTARILDFATLDSFMRAVDDQGPPDLLVLDLILPGIKGCEGVARARDRCLHTRIAVYSALPAADQGKSASTRVPISTSRRLSAPASS